MTTTAKSRSLIVLLIILVMEMKTSSNANIAEYDEYWTNKARLARIATEEAYHQHPYNVTNHLNHQVKMTMKDHLKNNNNTRRGLAGKYKGACKVTNPIDKCWRCQDDWEQNRMRLADCAIGFGRGTTGGKGGRIYVVTDPSDDDMVNPRHGTLRHAVIQEEPLWIIFSHSMVIMLNQELIMTGNKTIDARGANVHIARGAQITIQYVQNVIIHGLHIHDNIPGNGGLIRDSINHYGKRTRSDGDGISIFGASRVWIDHVSLGNCSDGLIDVIMGSTAITISNNHLVEHNEVLLFGANDHHTIDKKMQITLAFNKFGKGLHQRMPRCRFGFFHLVNNDYHWLYYAIGGTKDPTIISQGNRFNAPFPPYWKQVSLRRGDETNWKSWMWRSENDLFRNGAYFRQSGSPFTNNPYEQNMIPAISGKNVWHLTQFAGPMKCLPNKGC